MSERTEVEVDGRTLSLSNLDKVMWPKSKTTKGAGHRLLRARRGNPGSAPGRPTAHACPIPRRRRRPALLREAHPEGGAGLDPLRAGRHGPRRRDRLRRLRRQTVSRLARPDGGPRAPPLALEGGRDGMPDGPRLRPRPGSARRDARVLHGRAAGARALPGNRHGELRQDLRLEGNAGVRALERLGDVRDAPSRSPTRSPRRSRRPSRRWSSRG